MAKNEKLTKREAALMAHIAAKTLTSEQAAQPHTARILDRLVDRKLIWSPCEPSGVTARYELRYTEKAAAPVETKQTEYVVHKRDKHTGKSLGFVKRDDDFRLVALFLTHAAATHVASYVENMDTSVKTEVLEHDVANPFNCLGFADNANPDKITLGFEPKQVRPGLALVVHVNSFTGLVCGGYYMRDGKKTGSNMRPSDIVAALAGEYATLPVLFLKV